MGREELIGELKRKGFSDLVVIAFEKVKRENFIPNEFKNLAYSDQPVPISLEATISQPSTIAFMLELLELKDGQKILEIGSGSGYVLALIGEISKNSEICGLEIIDDLVKKSRERLKGKGVKIINKSGYEGYEEGAPFDRILVSASFDRKPESLFKQLGEGGILVCPVGNSIYKFRKINGGIEEVEYPGFVFVPMIRS